MSAESTATTAEGMIEEGKRLAALAPNIVVKLPVCEAGLAACRALADAGVRVNMTLVFSPTQALMAANAGARYISPFVGRFDDIAEDGISQLDNVVTCIKNYDWTGKNVDDTVEIITASVRTPNHVTQAALLGADIATVPMAALKKCLHHPLTDQGLASLRLTGRRSSLRLNDRVALGIAPSGAGVVLKRGIRMTNQELAKVANEVRKGVVTAVHAAKSGHPGGSLGAADIMTYLYFEEMNIDPADPHKADRDRFVLSKGHAAPGLYSVLANRGYFPVEELETLRHIGSRLQGHPNMNDTPGIDMSTGSLGQGISAAVGMALAAKHWGDSYRVYTLLGDGECEEGQVWRRLCLPATMRSTILLPSSTTTACRLTARSMKSTRPCRLPTSSAPLSGM